MRLAANLLISFSIVALAGCSARQAAISKVLLANPFDVASSFQNVTLETGVEYLEFAAPDATGLLALQYIDGDTRVYNSNEGAIIRITGGKLADFHVGQKSAWTQVRYTANGVQYDMPSAGVYQQVRPWQAVAEPTPVSTLEKQAKRSGLAKRALKVQNLELQSFEFGPPAGATVNPRLKSHSQTVSIAAFQNGVPVYGRHCYTDTYCVEYLVRSSAQNL